MMRQVLSNIRSPETIDCEVSLRMKFRHLLLFLMCLLCLGADADTNYGVSENSVVATPIGYEKEATLSTGETVKSFSDALSVDDVTNCHAVMFSILYPPRHRKRQFILRHSGCSCYMCALPAPMTNLYQIGKCYLFENPHTVSNVLLSSYAIRQPVPALKMERDWGTELYCSVKDVDERIKELDGFVARDQSLLKEYRSQLQQLPNETFSRKRRHELKCRILQLEHKLTNDVPNARSKLLKRRKWLETHEASNGGDHEDAIDGSHIVNVAVPIPSMTNDVVRVLNCSRVSTVVTKCTDLEKFVPDQNAVDLVAQSDVYLSLGLPFEDSLCKRALQKNSALKIFNVTNGCYTIDKNIYVWLTPENMTTIAANVRRSLLPENKFLSWSCMSLKDQYKNLGLTVAIAHPALEYPCRYFGLRFVRIYDSAGLIKREEIKRIIRDSNAVIILAVECQMEELPLVVPQGIEVGAIDIFEETALVQFTKLIHRAVDIYTDTELENTGDNNCEHR